MTLDNVKPSWQENIAHLRSATSSACCNEALDGIEALLLKLTEPVKDGPEQDPQARLDDLCDRFSGGLITPLEKNELIRLMMRKLEKTWLPKDADSEMGARNTRSNEIFAKVTQEWRDKVLQRQRCDHVWTLPEGLVITDPFASLPKVCKKCGMRVVPLDLNR